MKFLKLCALLGFSFLFSACSFLLPPKESHKKLFFLNNPVAPPVSTKKALSKTLLVTTIRSPSWLDTHDMAYIQNGNQMNYFAENQWIASPPELLQPIVTQALQNAGIYRIVISQPYSGKYDHALDLQLLNMEQVFNTHPSYYHLTMRVRLMNALTQKVIAVQTFDIRKQASRDNPQGGVSAANQAVSQLVTDIIQFVHDYAKS